ncbi:MAG: type I methionyl aminopeptidase [Chitinispirillales bacterium]|nr:type I methionyl aminopeptidase [Chitinispirillales bacterium]
MTGRNEPCPCRSGKKFKHCCINKDTLKFGAANKKIFIKTPQQIEKMQIAGKFNAQLMDYIRPFVKAGISTGEINRLVHNYTIEHGHIPGTLNYNKFPKSCCISRNDIVCHGIPNDKEFLLDGDIVNIDLTTNVDGWFGDQNETFFIGKVDPVAKNLVLTAREAIIAAINGVAPGLPLSIVGDIIEPIVKKAGCSVVREYTGHGIGNKFHEDITVLHHQNSENKNIILQPGMTFTIEPMINAGDWRVTTDKKDGWTVRTKDGSLSAQFEHTILITEFGADVLTLTESQKEKDVIIDVPKES